MLTQLTESLWGDEAFSAVAVQKQFGDMVGVVMRDTAPPLFYVLGWVWGRVFGFSEVALRSLSLLLIGGTAVFAGMIVYRIQKKWKVASLTALLTFFTPFLGQFGFEWRMYALLAFTITGSIYFFVAKKWTGYVIFSLAALYTHHFALFTVAGEGVVFLLTEFKWKWKKLKPFGVVGLLYLPWLYPMYLQTVRVRGSGFWLTAPTLEQVGELVGKFLEGGGKILAIPVAALLLFKDWWRVGKKWIELAMIFAAPIVLAFAVSHLVTPIFYDRYLLSVAVGTAVLLGLGTRGAGIWILAGMVVAYGYVSWGQFTHPKKRPFRDMAGYVKTVMRPGDRLLNYNGRAHHLWESKYYGIPAPIYTAGGQLPFYVGVAQMTAEDTVRDLPKVKEGRLGVIASEPVDKIVLPGFKLLEYKQFGELVFGWWKNEGADGRLK
ncbi:hypothetical protein HYS82_02540 [Candidatus Amesbacteria bacterium]|nr:hypothetical protein [Candidatus Amesbacteria bacterium]